MGIIEEIKAPDLISISNLLVGFTGIWLSISSVYYGCSALIISGILDGADGAISKWEKSAMGKQMDSLADIVSFGVLSGLIIVLYSPSTLSLATAGFIVTTGMLRLARFNIIGRENFEGIPITFTGIAISLLVLADFPPWSISIVALALSALMISWIEYEKVRNSILLFIMGVLLIMSAIYGVYGIKPLAYFPYPALILLLAYALHPFWRYVNERRT